MTKSLVTPKITARHYQALCGLALATIFLFQLQQSSSLMIHLLMLVVGTCCILLRFRLSPLLVFVTFTAAQAFEQYNQIRFVNFQRFPFLNLGDIMLCIAMLTYLVGQYRLNGLRFGVLADARLPANPARSEDSLTAAELVGLIFPVPLCALAGQAAMLMLTKNWGPDGMGPVWRQLFLVAWTLLLGLFLAAHGFRYWRRLQMNRTMALLMLQDVLWKETGGEQRRIERWTAWRKLNP